MSVPQRPSGCGLGVERVLSGFWVKDTIVNTTTLALAVALLVGLSGCGGGGGGGSSSGGGGSTAQTPMDSLVVPDTMTWSTAQQQGLQLSVLHDASGAGVADAVVSIYSFTRIGPNSDQALAQPVPQALIDSGVSAADGRLSLAAQIPAYFDEVLVVVSAGAAAVSQVVSTQQLSQPLTVRLAL
jgi:hypothetical protein